MTTIAVVPAGFANNDTDFLKAKVDRSGAARIVAGSVTVPNGTAATSLVGLLPFQRGARIKLDDKSIHVANIGAATTTVDIGVAYADATPDVLDAFVSASTAIQAGGFIAIDEIAGLTLVTQADGWLVARINTANTDAEGAFTFQALVAYDA